MDIKKAKIVYNKIISHKNFEDFKSLLKEWQQGYILDFIYTKDLDNEDIIELKAIKEIFNFFEMFLNDIEIKIKQGE